MTGTTNIDTTDLMQVERPLPKVFPPLDTPTRSPYFISSFPTTSVVNADAIRNFTVPNIPSFRISPPPPLSLSGAGTNATPTVTVSSFNILQPPAPTISQTLTSIPVGYQFSFLQVNLPLGSSTAISTYKIYRSATSSNTNAQIIDTVSHNPSNTGVPVVIQDAQPNGSTFFYFVSAVSTAGVESSLTPAQAQGVTVTNNAGFDSNSRLASSLHNTAVNVTFAPTSATTLSNDGSHTAINVSATTNLFASGGVAYNSGSVDPGSFNTWYVFVDDPQFLGGAVAFQSTNSAPFNQAGAEGRLTFGKIATGGGAKTGGGYTGGTTPGAAGGRGYVQ